MHYLAIQNTYTHVQVALFEGGTCKETQSLDKIHASSRTIPTIAQLLSKHSLMLSDISFIATNQGPGPFTTLRVVIATANGISYAHQIPLVGVDGFDALLKTSEPKPTVILFNAFSGDVYYALADEEKILKKGYGKIHTVIDLINEIFPNTSITYTGNGISLFNEKLLEAFPSQNRIYDETTEYASIESVGLLGLQSFNAGAISYQLDPLYLKKATPAHLSLATKAQ